jgi:EF-hand domain pair
MMRMLVSGSVVLLMLQLCGSTLVAAQGRQPSESFRAKYPGFDPFVSWAAIWGDPKGEGVYTCEQWKEYATRLFNQADRNRDGYVDPKEFEAIRNADPMFRDADLGYFDDNRDGRLSRSEFVDKPNPLFARYDKKGTCRVTLDDIAAETAPAAKGRRPR